MARITYGKKFRTRRGKYGCYKYVNGRKVAFVQHGTYKKRKGGGSHFYWGKK